MGRHERSPSCIIEARVPAPSPLVERWKVVQRAQPQRLEEGHRGAIDCRTAWRVRASALFDQALVEEGAHHVVTVDAANALDLRTRDRLTVRHDGQRLQRCRREPGALRDAEETRHQPSMLRSGGELYARAQALETRPMPSLGVVL